MPEQWATVAEAAAFLKVHPRTIERRIVSGKLDSRRADDGQVQVCIEVPEPVVFEPHQHDPALETVKELADRQVDIAAGSASAIVRIAQEAAERLNYDLALARTDLDVARRSGRKAWIATGVLATLLPIAVMAMLNWGVQSLAEERANVRVLTGQLNQTRHDLRTVQEQQVNVEQSLDGARLASARLEGEITAYKQRITELSLEQQKAQAEPTTRPAGLVDRLAQLFLNE